MADEIIETENLDPITSQSLEKVGDVIAKIERSKQQTALAQIEATNEDNKRQFEFAMEQAKNSKDRWNKSFLVAVLAVAVLMVLSIYLIVFDDKSLGLGLLASTFTGVFGYLAGVGTK